MSEVIERTVRIGVGDNERTETFESFDVVFLDLNLTVLDTVLMRESENKLRWKRFVPFQKSRLPKIEKNILQSISGVFRFRRFTAIMGASGAGKTSLLTQISGQLPKNNTRTSGRVFIRGHPFEFDAIKSISGFVFQDDVILGTMTVKEALEMSAKLRLPPEINKKDRVDRMIKDVSLEKAKNTQIGVTGGKKGISGGERKRTSNQNSIKFIRVISR